MHILKRFFEFLKYMFLFQNKMQTNFNIFVERKYILSICAIKSGKFTHASNIKVDSHYTQKFANFILRSNDFFAMSIFYFTSNVKPWTYIFANLLKISIVKLGSNPAVIRYTYTNELNFTRLHSHI